ncbi:MAG: SocA family protein [Treponema sp.]|jgi:hypothetical protein|nr:SocA family protein [Treponema sp.]
MLIYRKERIDNAVLFFAKEHYKKTKNVLFQTALYKYLAFFEFRYLKKYGEMPLGFEYRAMEHGPVPIEIYEHQENNGYFRLVTFEPVDLKGGGRGYTIKPKGSFNSNYFAETELEEMSNLIMFFAQRWVTVSIMSDSSHKEIKAWRTAYKKGVNTLINPLDEFERDIFTISNDDLTPEEERYLIQKSIRDYCVC